MFNSLVPLRRAQKYAQLSKGFTRLTVSSITCLNNRFSYSSQHLRNLSTSSQANLSALPLEESPEEQKQEYLKINSKENDLVANKSNDYTFRALSIVHACLKIGKFDRANRQISHIKKNQPKVYPSLIDINVHNAFINAYMEHKPIPLLRKGIDQFNKIKKLGLVPNLTTFATLIKGHIRANKLNLMKILYQEMLACNFTLDSLKSSSHLTDEEVNIFLKAIGKDSEPVLAADLSEALYSVETEGTDAQSEATTERPDSGLLAVDVLGVKLLKDTLKNIPKNPANLYQMQLKLEESALESAFERIQKEAEGRGDKLLTMNLSPLRKLMATWKVDLTKMIREEQNRIRTGNYEENGSAHVFHGPLFCLLSPEKMALITIQTLFRCFKAEEKIFGSIVNQTVNGIGSSVEMEYHAEQMRIKDNRYLFKDQQEISNLYSSGKLFALAVRNARAKVEREKIKSDWITDWPLSSKVKIGAMLLSMLIDSATFTLPKQEQKLTAFSHSIINIKGNRLGVIMYDPYITDLLLKEPSPSAYAARFLPMVVIPKPWLTYNSGGFYSTRLKCMRSRNCFEQSVYLKKSDELGLMSTVLTSLDVLGAVKWRIYNPVLEVIKQVWNTGEEFAQIPPAHTNVEFPSAPVDMSDPRALRSYRSKCIELKNLVRNNHSLRCDVNYKVEIAEAFKEVEFYFPHNLDFRGRAYPIPPLFNHLGNDLCRGLLTFSEAKPLKAAGLRWLKIQVASLSGFDKASFDDRVKFSEDHLEDIHDSADNPLTGKRWWLTAEDPWQCLAACFELTNALRSEDPEAYPCALPIHQDGTCNGLQHYAALGGDIAGAKHVNLEKSEKPQDIYSGVLDLVKIKLEKDAESGVKEAKALLGNVTRKVVKQTVMTNVYGVTFIGAKAQILSKLKEISQLEELDLNVLAFYLTRLVFSSLGEIFTSAQALQNWLNECAGRISSSLPGDVLQAQLNPTLVPKEVEQAESIESDESKSKGKTIKPVKVKKSASVNAKNIRALQMTSVVWTTPLGLTIVQPYRKGNAREIETKLQSIHIRETSSPSPVNSRKQRTAFPPNFVHSLDASHMMLTSIAMAKDGLAFASVHDSYWTHACDVDTMNLHIRTQFIDLHSKPIMENLLNEFKERYKGYKRRAPVSKEPEFDLEKDFSQSLLEGAVDSNSLSSSLPKSISSPKNRAVEWVDLEFPPLPPRGDFDISSVRDSPYFFH